MQTKYRLTIKSKERECVGIKYLSVELVDQVVDFHFEFFVNIYRDFPLENIPIED